MTNDTRTQLWARQIKKEVGIDVYQNNRRRETVEYRSLLYYLMNKRLKMTLSDIARHFKHNCRPTFNHATVLHGIDMFDVYRKYNSDLNKLGAKLAVEVDGNSSKIRKSIVEQVEFIDGEYLEYLKQIVQKMYNNTIRDEQQEDIDSIPTH